MLLSLYCFGNWVIVCEWFEYILWWFGGKWSCFIVVLRNFVYGRICFGMF